MLAAIAFVLFLAIMAIVWKLDGPTSSVVPDVSAYTWEEVDYV